MSNSSAKPVTIEGVAPGTSSGGTSLAPTTVFDHGRKSSIGTTAVQITSTSIPTSFGVTVKADTLNAGIIYVGNSDVTADTTDATDGFQLYPGDSVTIEVNNANKVYVIGSTTTVQKVFWIAA